VNLTDLVGSAAAFLTTASFLPQAWLSFKTHDVSGVSLLMYSVFTVGVALWLAYGVLLHSWPMVIANSITLVLALMILGMKLRYEHAYQPPKPGEFGKSGKSGKPDSDG